MLHNINTNTNIAYFQAKVMEKVANCKSEYIAHTPVECSKRPIEWTESEFAKGYMQMLSNEIKK